jgi:predicted negative regulator of RcsB-dependent stress response
MGLLEHIIQVWEFLVENSAVFAGKFFGFDPKPFVPWAQLIASLLAMVASCWGLLNLINHFDFRRRRLLANFLSEEEKKILELKSGLARRFINPVRNTGKADSLDVHSALIEAVTFFDAGKISKAEQELKRLNELLVERQMLAQTQSSLASKQSAAVHLFLGSIAASQRNTQEAKRRFKDALAQNRDDLDAQKYLVEQHLILAQEDLPSRSAHLNEALSQCTEFLSRATSEREYKAEALKLQGEIYLAMSNKGLARDALKEAGDIAESLSNHRLKSIIFERLGSAWGSQFHKEAKIAFGKSRASYKHLGLDAEADRVQRLSDELSRNSNQPSTSIDP